jgi:stearoyl-CoA desaturase (delta-9 desaturase)
MWLLIIFIALWYSSLFCQTFFQHRYAAHQAFTMNKFWERTFFIFTYITQGSSYMSPRAYAIMHRMHHAYTDTEKDPHSPEFSRNVFQMMLRTRKIYSNIYKGKIEIEERFTRNLPDWPAFDKWAHSSLSRICWTLGYIIIFLLLSPSFWWLLLLPIVVGMGVFHGAIINWFAHKYGYTNFKLKNTSQNLFSVDVFMLGESYHNNHHKHPTSVNFGRRWHEVDPVYPIIKILARLRIINMHR